MKLLITGASGLLGINLAMEAMRAHEVIGVDRGKLKSAPFSVIKADLLHRNAIDSVLDLTQPDWLINCAALANLEECEEYPDRAKILNTDLPRELASACANRNIRFVHLSTDAVFDGTKEGLYTEQDEPGPQGVYSKTKLDGEGAVMDAHPNAIIARVNFYGWSLSGKRSLGEFFVNNLSEGKNVNGFTDVIFCPMWVNHLAQTLIAMLKKDLSGLYHVVGAQAMSKYQFGVEVAARSERAAPPREGCTRRARLDSPHACRPRSRAPWSCGCAVATRRRRSRCLYVARSRGGPPTARRRRPAARAQLDALPPADHDAR